MTEGCNRNRVAHELELLAGATFPRQWHSSGVLHRKQAGMIMRSSITIANYFLQKCWNEDMDLSPMHVIKLVYLAHGWHLGVQGKPLICDRIRAWRYGPVIPELYLQVNQYGGGPITARVTSPFDTVNNEVLDEAEQSFLDTIWEHYRAFSALELSALTHRKGTPWYHAKRGHSRRDLASRSIPISSRLIKDFYRRKLNAAVERADSAN